MRSQSVSQGTFDRIIIDKAKQGVGRYNSVIINKSNGLI